MPTRRPRLDVISRRSLPVTPPLWPSVTTWLLLDRLDAPGVVRGIVYTLLAAWWAVSLTALAMQRPRPVWPDETPRAP